LLAIAALINQEKQELWNNNFIIEIIESM